MTPGILDEPLRLSPITRVSPSRYEALTQCALREAWAAGGQPLLLPLSPAARLGTAIHALLEGAGKGQIEAERGAVERRWAELLGGVEAAMRGNWLERQFVPLRPAVPDFEVRRIRAQSQALAIAEAAASVRGEVRPERSVTGFEQWVESEDGTIGGYIDRVLETRDGLTLRDYKSGGIHDLRAVGQAPALKESYVVQLRLYAALFAAKTGRWPDRLELVPLGGEPTPVPFTREECQALLEDAVAVLGRINAAIAAAASNPPDVEARLAAPSLAGCWHCPFRPGCDAYRRAREAAAADEGWPEDLWGEVSELRQLGNGKLLLTIAAGPAGGEARTVRGITPGPDRHPALARLRAGDRVGLFNLKGVAGTGTASESSWTVLYTMKSGDDARI